MTEVANPLLAALLETFAYAALGLVLGLAVTVLGPDVAEFIRKVRRLGRP